MGREMEKQTANTVKELENSLDGFKILTFPYFLKKNYRPFINDFISFIQTKGDKYGIKPLTKTL